MLLLAKNYGQPLSSVDAASLSSDAAFQADFAAAVAAVPEPAALLAGALPLVLAGRRRRSPAFKTI